VQDINDTDVDLMVFDDYFDPDDDKVTVEIDLGKASSFC